MPGPAAIGRKTTVFGICSREKGTKIVPNPLRIDLFGAARDFYFRDEFAADCPLQRRVYKLSVPLLGASAARPFSSCYTRVSSGGETAALGRGCRSERMCGPLNARVRRGTPTRDGSGMGRRCDVRSALELAALVLLPMKADERNMT
jgi:hypothetical protein